MSSVPKISICIPVYNGQLYIRECIESVLIQEFKDFEILVMDNCSSDETKEIILGIQDERIKYLCNESNIGSIGNFNKCIQQATADYFLLLPHDDLLLPNALSSFNAILENKDVSFVYSSVRIVDEEGKKIRDNINYEEDRLFSSIEGLGDIAENFVPIQLAMVRTSVIKNSEGFDKTYGLFCDIKLWLEILSQGYSSFYHSDPLSCHRVHSEQGQIAFLENNLKKVEEHWGEELSPEFWFDNNYNYLLLKLIKFINSAFNKEEKRFKNLITILKIKLAYSSLKKSYQSTMKLNRFLLTLELKIIYLFIKAFGLREFIFCYFSALKRYVMKYSSLIIKST